MDQVPKSFMPDLEGYERITGSDGIKGIKLCKDCRVQKTIFWFAGIVSARCLFADSCRKTVNRLFPALRVETGDHRLRRDLCLSGELSKLYNQKEGCLVPEGCPLGGMVVLEGEI